MAYKYSFLSLSSFPVMASRLVLLRGRPVAQQCAMFSSAHAGAVKYALVQTGSYRQARQRVLTHRNRCKVGVCIQTCDKTAVYWIGVALIDAENAVKMEAAAALESSRHSLLLLCLHQLSATCLWSVYMWWTWSVHCHFVSIQLSVLDTTKTIPFSFCFRSKMMKNWGVIGGIAAAMAAGVYVLWGPISDRKKKRKGGFLWVLKS